MAFDPITAGMELGKKVLDMLTPWIPDPAAREKAAQSMVGLMLEEKRIDAADRDSARQREMVVKDATPRNIAYAYTAGYFANLYLVWKYGVPAEAHDMFLMLEGVLTAAQGAIMNYYFGSSKGSDDKTKFMMNGK